MTLRSLARLGLIGGCAFLSASGTGLCDSPPPAASSKEPVTFTTQEDHRNMLEQLRITRLRPGPSGSESAPNHANYDESLANPYPDLPDPLLLKNGQRATTAEMWWKQLRPQIVEDFEREVIGRVPSNVP